MTHERIFEHVSRIVAETLDIEDLVLDPSMSAADIPGWDSLSNVQIMVAVERAFGVRFHTGDIASMANLGELVARVESRVARH
jgi:acyl carrier protein